MKITKRQLLRLINEELDISKYQKTKSIDSSGFRGLVRQEMQLIESGPPQTSGKKITPVWTTNFKPHQAAAKWDNPGKAAYVESDGTVKVFSNASTEAELQGALSISSQIVGRDQSTGDYTKTRAQVSNIIDDSDGDVRDILIKMGLLKSRMTGDTVYLDNIYVEEV
jgi:hypothetical protein